MPLTLLYVELTSPRRKDAADLRVEFAKTSGEEDVHVTVKAGTSLTHVVWLNSILIYLSNIS